jgi:drug/metabolite transporter (DMT)-like permease
MKKIRAGILLLITTFFWGVTFTIVKDAIRQVDVFVFLSQRFLAAFLILLPIAMVKTRRLPLQTVKHGIILGVLLFAAYAFQTVALKYTSASNTGFLTGLNVVFVPIMGGFFFGQAVSGNVKWGVLLSVTGLFFLCSNGAWVFNNGDLLATICGGCVALHLLYTSEFARRADSNVFWLTTIQLGTVALLSILAAKGNGNAVFVWYPGILWTLVICVLVATVFAFLVQTSMQRFISPAHTALIFCSEPVFAALYAYWAASERLGFYGMIGALLILAGMIVAEALPERNPTEAVLQGAEAD